MPYWTSRARREPPAGYGYVVGTFFLTPFLYRHILAMYFPPLSYSGSPSELTMRVLRLPKSATCRSGPRRGGKTSLAMRSLFDGA